MVQPYANNYKSLLGFVMRGRCASDRLISGFIIQGRIVEQKLLVEEQGG